MISEAILRGNLDVHETYPIHNVTSPLIIKWKYDCCSWMFTLVKGRLLSFASHHRHSLFLGPHQRYWLAHRAQNLPKHIRISTLVGMHKLTMKEKWVVSLGTLNKPLHRIYHVLSRRTPFFIVNIVCEYQNVFWFIMVFPWELSSVNTNISLNSTYV